MKSGGKALRYLRRKSFEIILSLLGIFVNQGVLIAPKKMNFPVIDFAFSCCKNNSEEALPVVAFQRTWAKSHKVKVKALW